MKVTIVTKIMLVGAGVSSLQPLLAQKQVRCLIGEAAAGLCDMLRGA